MARSIGDQQVPGKGIVKSNFQLQFVDLVACLIHLPQPAPRWFTY